MWRKKEIQKLMEKDNYPYPSSNDLIFSLVGSEELAEKWWVSPNKAFDMRCPKDVDEKEVHDYLMWHAYAAGG